LLADPPVCTCVAPLQNVDGVCKCPPSAGRAQHLVRGQCTLLLTEIKDSLENDQQYSGIMQKVSRIAEALKNFLRAVHLIN